MAKRTPGVTAGIVSLLKSAVTYVLRQPLPDRALGAVVAFAEEAQVT